MLKRIVERRGCDAAHVAVAPVDTAQPCSPRSCSSEILFDGRVYMKKTTRKRWTRSEISSNHHRLVRVLNPGQQSHSNWGIGRITAEGCLLVGVGSNLRGNTFSPTERVIGMRTGSVTTTPVASSKTASLQTNRFTRN